jgi:hypothetical protein
MSRKTLSAISTVARTRLSGRTASLTVLTLAVFVPFCAMVLFFPREALASKNPNACSGSVIGTTQTGSCPYGSPTYCDGCTAAVGTACPYGANTNETFTVTCSPGNSVSITVKMSGGNCGICDPRY